MQLGWVRGLGTISLALNPGVELLPEEERVNAFRVKMHLPQLQEFALVAADEVTVGAVAEAAHLA